MKCFVFVLISALAITGSGAQSSVAKPNDAGFYNWFKGVPQLELEKVEFHSQNFEEALNSIRTELFIPFNLYGLKSSTSSLPFYFSAAQCRAEDVLNSLSRTYNVRWEQDSETGVIWIFPAALTLEVVLPQRLSVPFSQYGLRLHLDVVKRICELYEGLDPLVDPAFERTYNPPVCINSGDYTVRTLLSVCAAQCPGVVFRTDNLDGQIYLGQLSTDMAGNAPSKVGSFYGSSRPGLVALWNYGTGASASIIPSGSEMNRALSSENPLARNTAIYCARAGMSFVQSGKKGDAEDGLPCLKTSAWLGHSAVIGFYQSASFPIGKGILGRLRGALSEDIYDVCPQLSLLSACDLIRSIEGRVTDLEAARAIDEEEFKKRGTPLTEKTSEGQWYARQIAEARNEERAVQFLMQHDFSSADLAGVMIDLFWLARSSGELRMVISQKPIRELVGSDIRLLGLFDKSRLEKFHCTENNQDKEKLQSSRTAARDERIELFVRSTVEEILENPEELQKLVESGVISLDEMQSVSVDELVRRVKTGLLKQ